MFRSIVICLLASLPTGFSLSAQSPPTSLSGTWQVKLDPDNDWVKKSPDDTKTEGMISLPASLAEAGYGYKTEGADIGILTPEYRYIGKAWYTREIDIPDSWKGKTIELFLERVLWQSEVYVDGKALSRKDALGTPHVHSLGRLTPGVHQLTVVVDNNMIHNIGDKGHAYSDYTQSIWNGIVGRIELRAADPVRFHCVRTFPNVSAGKLKVEWTVRTPKSTRVRIGYSIVSVSSGEEVIRGELKQAVSEKDSIVVATIPVGDKLAQWSEFNPEVYVLKSVLKAGRYADASDTEFGYCEVTQDGTKILINGQPVFLRGNLDCVHFPTTGYPSCDMQDWIEIFQKYKAYGLNHARFHSWCPPEAAFVAANRIGIYLQAEASVWIDWWMSADMTARGRPEMETKGHPEGVGKDPERDRFIVAEMHRVVDFYGNHPSFSMFCIGNELGNGDFDVMAKWIGDLKKKDPRRLYAASTARQITATDDYSATHNIPDIGRTRGLNGSRTDWDFESTYGPAGVPIIAHEIGQWPVYPCWSEMEKYTGVLKARNLAALKVLAEKNGVVDQDEDFAQASGALNQIMYKYETESFLRTPSCAGVQLLSMQDYQGQGEALVGWLDCHWESKDITTPEQFGEHFTTTVPLLRMEKFVWENNEVFKASAQLAHHGKVPLEPMCTWTVTDTEQQIIAAGDFPYTYCPVGSLSDLGDIILDLSSIRTAQKLKVGIQVEGTEFRNSWDIWVYPAGLDVIPAQEVYIADELDDHTMDKLREGNKVLLVAHQLGTEESAVDAHYYPLYWSLTWFPGQGKTNIGLLVDDRHPAFDHFPTAAHSDWQWETICGDAKGFILNDLPGYRPIAQPVDDFHRSNKVGSVFELKVGAGKLLVCGYNLDSGLPVARQLKKSVLAYMNSEHFDPKQEVTTDWLLKLMPVIPKAIVADVPAEYHNAILYVDAAGNLRTERQNIPWKNGVDDIRISEGASYTIKADGTWKGDHGSAWHGEELELVIDCPEGWLGSLLVQFQDWDDSGRTGLLEFEGRKTKLGSHKGGQWIQFHVMREDSMDGELVLRTRATSGHNLMITRVVLLADN
jgi:hypothetical protein